VIEAAAVTAVTVVGACVAPAAEAQVSSPVTVTRVVDGDTVDARLADGRELAVRLIGIDAPEAGECGTDPAGEALRRLVEGQAVNLVGDPTQDAMDRFGRSLFYVDRAGDGLDVGEEMLRRGWAEVFVYERDFERLPRYEFAAVEAFHRGAGVWARCEGDFHRSRADDLRSRRLSAADFMRRYYSSLSRRRFLTAWRMLGRPPAAETRSLSTVAGGLLAIARYDRALRPRPARERPGCRRRVAAGARSRRL
jgi:endonuclease YncB( thermonuclease family)